MSGRSDTIAHLPAGPYPRMIDANAGHAASRVPRPRTVIRGTIRSGPKPSDRVIFGALRRRAGWRPPTAHSSYGTWPMRTVRPWKRPVAHPMVLRASDFSGETPGVARNGTAGNRHGRPAASGLTDGRHDVFRSSRTASPKIDVDRAACRSMSPCADDSGYFLDIVTYLDHDVGDISQT